MTGASESDDSPVAGAPATEPSPPAPDVTRARNAPTDQSTSGVRDETSITEAASGESGVPDASGPSSSTATAVTSTSSLAPPTSVVSTTSVPAATVDSERAAGPATTTDADAAIPQRRVLVIGDSTAAAMRWTRGATDALVGSRFTLDLESCRRLVTRSCLGSEGYTPSNALDALQWHDGGRHDTLIIATGYNDVGRDFADAFDRIVTEARRQQIETIIWTTYREDVGPGLPLAASSAYAEMNDQLRLRMGSGNYPELRLLDWWEYTKDAPDWVVDDGVHLTRTGAFGFADLISRELAALDGRACPVGWELFAAPADPCPRPVAELARRGALPPVLYLYDALR